MFHKELVEVLKDISISLRKLSNRSEFPITSKSSKEKIEMKIESSNLFSEGEEQNWKEIESEEITKQVDKLFDENRNDIKDQFFAEDAIPLELLEDK